MNFDDEQLERLILDGIVEFAGLDDNGEMLYSFSSDLEEKAPAIHKMVMEMHMQDIYYLWERGFLQMDVTLENPLATITPKALDDNSVSRLPKHMQIFLEQIKDAMRGRSGE